MACVDSGVRSDLPVLERFHTMSDADGERGRCCLSALYGVLVVSSAIAAAVVDLLVTEEADIVAKQVCEWSNEV